MDRLNPDVSQWLNRFDNPAEQQMRAGFIKSAEEVLDSAEAYQRTTDQLFVGLEIELPLVDQALNPAVQAARDAIVGRHAHYASVELGSHQLELINNPALDILDVGIEALEKDFELRLSQLRIDLAQHNLRILRLGCFPFCSVEALPFTQGYTKYERCPQWHRQHQQISQRSIWAPSLQVDVSNPYVVSLMNAVHVSVDASSFDDAIDKLNRSLMISPLAIALGANAQYLNCTDTGFADVRFAAWEYSHDTRLAAERSAGRRTRIGLPRRYYTSVAEYLQRILSYPFILNDPVSLERPFEVGSGTYWRDARLKFFRDKHTIAVEFRPIALQPTLHEDLALTAFFLGRLTWSQVAAEPLLSLKKVQWNKRQAERHGINCTLYGLHDGNVIRSTSISILKEELTRSEQGLRHLGMSAADSRVLLEPLHDRLQLGCPAEQLSHRVEWHEKRSNPSSAPCHQKSKDALLAAIEDLHLLSSVS